MTHNLLQILSSALMYYVRSNGVNLAKPVENLQMHGKVAMFKIGDDWHTCMLHSDECSDVIDFADYGGNDITETSLKEWLDKPRDAREYIDAVYTTFSTSDESLHPVKLARGNRSESLKRLAAMYFMRKAGTVSQRSDDEYF